MSKEAFDKIMEGMQEALAISRGEAEPHRWHIPASVNVKAIRHKTGLTQEEFASRFGFTRSAVRDWEQNRRTPEQAARVLLLVIGHNPAAVIEALAAA